ncbi:MAG: protoporphyrinogen oxidase HemJ [Chitinophagales bacterium]
METTIIYAFKALHIIGFVTWFAGLFYLARIFVYHVEANDRDETERNILQAQYNIMAARLYRIITNPAMMITWTFGIAMLVMNPAYLKGGGGWMHVKLTLVVLLTVYHLYCKGLIKKLEEGKPTLDPFQLRLFNEIPSLFLVAIVLLAVLTQRNLMPVPYVVLVVTIFGALVYMGAKAYQRKRLGKK